MKKVVSVVFLLALTLLMSKNSSSICTLDKAAQECTYLTFDSENEQPNGEVECDLDDEKFHYPKRYLQTRNQDRALSHASTLSSVFSMGLLRPPKTA